jgi:two-component system, chemotaxis family, response regulator PixG
METLFSELRKLQDHQETGQLRVRTTADTPDHWRIYLRQGKIVWVTGSKHFIRRWCRIAQHYAPSLVAHENIGSIQGAALQGGKEFNEFQQGILVTQAIEHNSLLLNKAKMFLQDHWSEFFFSVMPYPALDTVWIPLEEVPQQCVWLYMNRTIESSIRLEKQWTTEVGKPLSLLTYPFVPDLAPLVVQPDQLRARVSANAYESLTKQLNGQLTFWDIAAQLQQPLIAVVKSLLPLVQTEIIRLVDIPDLPSPLRIVGQRNTTAKPQKVTTASNNPSTQGVIACIDDSPTIGRIIEGMLKPLGYEVFSILDPLQGFSQLLERKPELIFLDLIMPNTNGYEVCAFLRKSAVFKETPIVMLTGQDGVIDRLRAKMVGSSEFLSKPPEADKVIQVVQRILRNGEVRSAASKSVLERIMTT